MQGIAGPSGVLVVLFFISVCFWLVVLVANPERKLQLVHELQLLLYLDPKVGNLFLDADLLRHQMKGWTPFNPSDLAALRAEAQPVDCLVEEHHLRGDLLFPNVPRRAACE